MKFFIVLCVTIGCGFGRHVVSVADNSILSKCTDGLQEFIDCVKYKAIKFLDNAIINKKPIPVANFLYLTHDGSTSNETTENIVADEEEAIRKSENVDTKLNELLVRRVRKLVSTKHLQVKLDADVDGVEGRKKKGKDKGGMMMMMGAGAMMMHAAMSKIALLAGKALILAKIALLLSAMMLLKKMMSSDDHHESAQVVWKQDSGSGGGGGGWHRSIDNPENIYAHRMAYGGQVHPES